MLLFVYKINGKIVLCGIGKAPRSFSEYSVFSFFTLRRPKFYAIYGFIFILFNGFILSFSNFFFILYTKDAETRDYLFIINICNNIIIFYDKQIICEISLIYTLMLLLMLQVDILIASQLNLQ